MDGIDYDFCQRQYGFSSAQSDAWFNQVDLPDYRTPDPMFSPISYLLMNPDVGKAQLHPVRHYLLFGRNEGRPWRRPITYTRFRGDLTRRSDAAPLVAFVLHIFYSQYIGSFVRRLQAINQETRLKVFISTSESLYNECSAAFQQGLPGRSIVCRVAPNRGRNISPMLTLFADDLVNCDVVFHCHSKLSEYSGRPQIEWASYLIAALIGNDEVVCSHVDAIASGECDLIAPVPFEGISPLACHSLSNDGALLKLQGELGLQPEVGFMTYPIGGMFVASRSLFRRLLDLGLDVADFPAEPSRPDGEIHHAIERLLGSIAGGRLAFFDQTFQRYCDRTSVLHEELMRFSPLDDLHEAVDQHDTICFDFFDTLCCRCSGDEEWAKKTVDHLFQSPFRQARNQAEATLRARLGPRQDVSVPQIYAVLESSPLPEALRLLGAERTIDLADTRPIARVAETYAAAVHCGKKVLIISDTYYGSEFIASFLKAHSLPLPSEILTSSETGLRKDRGDMWIEVRQRFSGRLLHIGDNVRSDLQAASDCGLTTFYVANWRNALLSTNGLSEKINARNRYNSCFNRLAEEQIQSDGGIKKASPEVDAAATPA